MLKFYIFNFLVLFIVITIYNMKVQNKHIGIRILETKLTEYFTMCEEEGFVMSKRIKKFMELDIQLSNSNKNSLKILQEHTKDEKKR